MAEPDLSVIIVTHNSRREIDDCLRSLGETAGDLVIEIILVDSASTDGTVDYVRAAWPDVRLVARGDNLGFARANNLAFGLATGRALLLLNPDTILQAGALAALIDRLITDERLGVVGPRLLNPDLSLQSSCREFPRLFNNFVGMTEIYRVPLFHRLFGGRFPSLSDHTEPIEVDWLVGACLVVRPAALADAGGLNEAFFMYAEEMEWQFRLRQKGWRIALEPAAEVIHLGGASTRRYPARRIIWQYDGLFRFYRLHYPAWQRWLLVALSWAITWPKIAVLLALSLVRREKHPLLSPFWQILWRH